MTFHFSKEHPTPVKLTYMEDLSQLSYTCFPSSSRTTTKEPEYHSPIFISLISHSFVVLVFTGFITVRSRDLASLNILRKFILCFNFISSHIQTKGIDFFSKFGLYLRRKALSILIRTRGAGFTNQKECKCQHL